MIDPNPYTAPNPQPEGDPPLLAQLSTDVEGMTVEFEQIAEDVLALHYYMMRDMGFKTPRRWVGLLYAALVLLLSGTVYAVLSSPALIYFDQFVSYAVTFLLISIFWSYGVPPLSRWVARLMVYRSMQKGHNLNLIGPRRFTITPQFFVSASPVTQSISRWVGVEKVLVEDEYLFIFVSTMSAYVLPRRAIRCSSPR